MLPLRNPQLLDRRRSGLLVIDVQVKLAPLITQADQVVGNLSRLLQGAAMFSVPYCVTEQYPQGLGKTVPELEQAASTALTKSMFSCRELFADLAAWQTSERHQLVIGGIEAHVCVQQTALDCLTSGWDVYVVVDAIGSRFSLDKDIALQRMANAGAILTTTESVLFEWCETSQDPQFKALSRLIKDFGPQAKPGTSPV